VLTVATAVVWSVLDASRAFSAAVAVLVVSCPCAFALAVPAALTRALAVLARCGVLVVRPDAIQGLAEATHVVFDKTGTLTQPGIALSDVTTFADVSRAQALSLAAALGRESRHPIARAIAACAHDSGERAREVTAHTGLGLSGTVGDRRLRLGQAAFAIAGLPPAIVEHARLSADAVWLADDSGPIAAFRLTERLRPDAGPAIDALRRSGLTLGIASGDAPSKVAQMAALLQISAWRARQLPADKLSWLGQLQASGARVIAVGDGVNDAPVLAGADVSIAVAGGAELARVGSDIVLADQRLMTLPLARGIAQQTLCVLHQNQRWALYYNLIAMPAAALGFVPPWLAALGMSLSSLVVILNALRIGREVTADPAQHATSRAASFKQRAATA
jgi:Cu2+-exporting ATPase